MRRAHQNPRLIRTRAHIGSPAMSPPRTQFPTPLRASRAFPSRFSFSALTLATLAASLFLPFAGMSANWPQFRGSTGLGHTDEKNLPLTWNARTGENILWKSPQIGRAHV